MVGVSAPVFQYWDGEEYVSYEAADQAALLAAFRCRSRPNIVALAERTYALHHFSRVEYGEAHQVNTRTQKTRHVRLRPPYALQGAAGALPRWLPDAALKGSGPRGLACGTAGGGCVCAGVRASDALPAAATGPIFEFEGLEGQWQAYGEALQRELRGAIACRPPPAQLNFVVADRSYRLLGLDTLTTEHPRLRQENITTGAVRRVRLARACGCERRCGGWSSDESSDSGTEEEALQRHYPSQMPLLARASFEYDATAMHKEGRRSSLVGCFSLRETEGRWQPLGPEDRGALLAALVLAPPPRRLALPSGAVVERPDELVKGAAGLLAQPVQHVLHRRKAVQLPLVMHLPRVVAGRLTLPGDLMPEAPAGGPSARDWGHTLSYGSMMAMLDREASGEVNCPICLLGLGANEDVLKLACGHTYHRECILGWFNAKKRCPTCQRDFGQVLGQQPRLGTMTWRLEDFSLPGHADAQETIVVRFQFPDGVDDSGMEYRGRSTKAYLPADVPGKLLLELFKVAFRRRVMYGLGQSMTWGTYRPTFNIHLKTSRCGGREMHGYPDDEYFSRCLDELKANGVTLSDLM